MFIIYLKKSLHYSGRAKREGDFSIFLYLYLSLFQKLWDLLDSREKVDKSDTKQINILNFQLSKR